MAKKPHPLLAAFTDVDRVRLSEGDVARAIRAHAIEVPWSASGGLCLCDLLVDGDAQAVLPIPSDLAMPPLRLTTSREDPLFLAQRWCDADIVAFEPVGRVSVDRGVVCVAPIALARADLDTEQLEDAVAATEPPFATVSADGVGFLIVHTGDCSAALYLAKDRTGATVGWVLNIADVEVPWVVPVNLVPESLRGFIKPQSVYAVAGRETPTKTIAQIANDLGVPDRCRYSLKVLAVEPVDYHFFADELARIGVVEPNNLERVLFEYHHIQSVADSSWRAMLAIMAEHAKDTRGVLYKIDGTESVDFASS